ncbi:MAG: ATPase [Lachnospiraceae bacterium]|nr:ATPase [Lachnospiraceae bacterium]
MLAESKRLEKEINKLNSEIKNLPEGKLVCTKNDNSFKWYVSINKQLTYIPKKKRNYAQKLAIRRYYVAQLENLSAELRAVKYYLQHSPKDLYDADSQLLYRPGYRDLLLPYFTPIEDTTSKWMTESYEQNPNHPEQLNIKTTSGKMVRSKSEAFIDMLLYTNKIPFRYECALTLGDTTYYPDYTIMHPKTGEIFYWEHFGMMDDPIYAGKTFSKLHTYSKYGIIPTINLITTYETGDNPLDLDAVQKIIEQYFL